MSSKLVRDRIPEIIRASGENPVTHTASDDEYLSKLCDKLQEESREFSESRNQEELADILEVIYALGAAMGKSPEELETIRKKKQIERGSFVKKIILEG